MSCEGVIMKYQLHDCEIDAIVLENNRIIFSFPDGFYVTDENGQELAPLRNKLVFVIDKETNESLESYVSVRRIKRGRRGWKGNLKKLWSVAPPALMAAMPVGASTTCFFLVCSQMYRRKVLFPVPALPVRKSERCV